MKSPAPLKGRNLFWLFIAVFAFDGNCAAQARMEKLDRGVVALRVNTTQAHVSWRMLGTDPDTIAFNLYRRIGSGSAIRLNGSPITNTTDYRDTPGSSAFDAGVAYFVRPVIAGVEGEASPEYLLPPGTPSQPFFSIPIQPPPAGTTPTGEIYSYSANDISPADLDGD